MSASEFPNPNTDGMLGIANAQIEAHRARVVVVHNSRIFIAMIYLIGISAAFVGISSILYAISLLFPLSGFSFLRVLAAAQWGISGLLFASMCPFMWQMAGRLAHPRVRLDGSGVEFNLGTKKAPLQLHMAWDQVSSIQQERVGNAQQFTVKATDGSYVQFNSYTFFRPKRVARLISERTGIVIQKA
jgi:hypothetical protein